MMTCVGVTAGALGGGTLGAVSDAGTGAKTGARCRDQRLHPDSNRCVKILDLKTHSEYLCGRWYRSACHWSNVEL